MYAPWDLDVRIPIFRKFKLLFLIDIPANIYMFKVNSGNTREMWESLIEKKKKKEKEMWESAPS